jgi:rhodanese-related sulfurtransferase
MKTYADLVNDTRPLIQQLFPWDLNSAIADQPELLLVDVREPTEFAAAHIAGSINVPRGLLEAACDWNYEETEPRLVTARNKTVVLICRSGNRSALAAFTLQTMGFQRVYSLQTGVRGWNDYELPLVDAYGKHVNIETADEYLTSRVRPDQLQPR